MEEKYVSTFLIASIIGGVIGGAIGLIIPTTIYVLQNYLNKLTN